MLGPSDQTLRIVPFAAACISMVMFFFLARNVVSAAAVPVAIGIFAVADPLFAIFGVEQAVRD